MSASDTLIVVAAVDDRFADNLPTYRGGPVQVMDTSAGGHPTGAYIRAYREFPEYESYLFIQDSLRGQVDDVVEPFRDKGRVVAWGVFPLFFDNDEQLNYCTSQWPGVYPTVGIFGPIFYATRKAMARAEPHFPRTPTNRMEAQGAERGWSFCFTKAGVPVRSLANWSNELMSLGPPHYPVFSKVFANRP